MGMHDLLESVNRHAAAVGMHTSDSKAKVMSALIPGAKPSCLVASHWKMLTSSNA